MENDSTTVVDNPSDDRAPGASFMEEPANTTETSTQTSDNADNLETSKSTDTAVTDDKSTTETSTATDTPASTFDDDLDEWIEKRGAPKPTTDTEKQAFQKIRDEQREFTREQQAKKDADALAQSIKDSKPEDDSDDDDDEDPVEKRLREIEADREAERTARLQSEFYAEKKITPELGKAMAEIFDEKMKKETNPAKQKQAFDYWSDPSHLDDLHELAQARTAKAVDNSAEKEAAQREERERIAKESNANSTGRGAKATVTTEKSDDQRRLETFSTW